MIEPEDLLLLDTNVLLHLVRNRAPGRWLAKRYALWKRAERPAISVISLGELARIRDRLHWGDRRKARVSDIAANVLVVGIASKAVTEAYGEMGAALNGKGKPIPTNDLWIAACSRATDATLLTTDKHFDDLHGEFITREFIDPNTLPKR